MAAETRVVVAQRICPYVRSQWFVLIPVSAPSRQDDLEAIIRTTRGKRLPRLVQSLPLRATH